MTKTKPIYEQVSAGTPGQPFQPSGLYALVGHMVHRRFVRASTPGPLRTLRQWQAVQRAPSPGQVPRSRMCGHCGDTFEQVRDANGDLMACPNCGLGWRDVSLPGAPLRFESYDAPDVAGRMLALRAHRDKGQIAELQPVAVVSRLLAPPPRRETYAPSGDMGARILAEQVRLGQRDAPQSPLRTMDASAPCARCGKRGCTKCPPPAPDIAAACLAQRARDVQRRYQADEAAYPALTRKL